MRLIGTARLRCHNDHELRAAAGVFDMLQDRQPASRVRDTYSTPLGWLYDFGVNARPLARVAGRLEWGADIGRMFRWMANGLDVRAGDIALDVPVGGGTSYAAGARDLKGLLLGVDLSAWMLSRAAVRRDRNRLRQHVVLARADATALPVVDRCVIRILSFNGLHVIADKAAAMREFRRVLEPGGELIGTTLVSDCARPYSGIVALERLAPFFVPPARAELALLARRAGFGRWEVELDGGLLFFRGE
jgi:SAM-dependent methyltransferase